MEQLSGQHIGKYQVVQEIGRGMIGTVYKGYGSDLNRPVAIKVLAPQFAGDPAFVEDFIQRARATSHLQHPHIVVVFDTGQQDGLVWMAMEYLDGIPLPDLVRLQGAMLVGEVQIIVQQLADVLDYLHNNGLFHGDVRAGNVFVCPPGRVNLTELGIIRPSWEGRVASSAVSASIAPEQVTGGELGAWTDLYALGTITYEMLGGRPPFEADSTAALLSQIVHKALPPISSLRPGLPAAVELVLRRAMAKDPHTRYRSGIEFLAALEEALRVPAAALATGPSVSPQPAAPPSPSPIAEPALVPAPGEVPAAPAAEEPMPEGAAPVPGPTAEPQLPPQIVPAELRLTVGEAKRPAGTPPPWESVPIRTAPPAPAAPPPSISNGLATPATPKITRPPGHGQPIGTPADRLARLRAAQSRAAAPKEKSPPAQKGSPLWLWLLLGGEILLLLLGVALAVLLLTGVLG